MDKGFLEDCLAKGMSLPQIGRIVEKSPSTVGYWVKKHGLEANGAQQFAPRGSLDREVLQGMVDENLTLREMAERLDRSIRTVRYWLDRHGLRSTGGRRRAASRCAREAGIRRIEMECATHGKTEFVLEGRGYYRCAACRVEAVSKRRQLVKGTLVEEAGGKCVVCGYARSQQALQFHHLDPSQKTFHLGHQGQSRSLARSREEASKCLLVCANCHAEIEAGLIRLPGIDRLTLEIDRQAA